MLLHRASLSLSCRTFLLPLNRHFCSVHDKCDIIIAGGGMVGLSMAASLGRQAAFKKSRIILLEAARKESFFELPNPSVERFKNRVSALSPATQKLLEDLGAWSIVESARFQPVTSMHVSESCSDSYITFEPLKGAHALAYIVENYVTQAAVTEVVNNCENVEVLYNAKVKNVDFPTTALSEPITVTLDGGHRLSSSLLIAADGFNSNIRRAAKIDEVASDYDGQHGLVATLEVESEGSNSGTEGGCAWQRFMPSGPIALLPLNSSFSSLVWTTSGDSVKTLLDMSDEDFTDALNHALRHSEHKQSVSVSAGSVLNQFLKFLPSVSQPPRLPPNILRTQSKSRAAFPLGLCLASRYIGPRLVLIGDAAHRVHPLAGQGVNLGIGDVMCLTDVLTQSLFRGADIGSSMVLREYETTRMRKCVSTALGVHSLSSLYGTDFPPVVLLRALGLQMTNALHPLRNFFVSFATS